VRGSPRGARAAAVAAALGVSVLGASVAGAQQTPPPSPTRPAAAPRRVVIIRGSAPTPEVITVRPREIPDHPRDILGAVVTPWDPRVIADEPPRVRPLPLLPDSVPAAPPAPPPAVRPPSADR
jgi:hypothetical protein